jgi:hypothetical protein
MNNNIIEKFQGGGKSTKTLRNFLNRASKTAESALTNLQDYGREKNLPRWITDAFDPNRDLAPYSGKEASGVLPEINMERFNYYPASINERGIPQYNFYKENPIQYYKEKPTPVLRQYTEYNPELSAKAYLMGLDRFSKDINIQPFNLISNSKEGVVTHNVSVPTYTSPVKNYLHPTNGARRVEATYMPSEGYVYKTEVNSPRDTYFEAKRVNEHELPSVKEQLKKKGFFNVSADNSPIYSIFDSADNSINVKFTKVPSSVEDIRHINTYIIPGKPFRNNQFLTKTVPATAGAGAAGALGAYVYNLLKDKSEEK